MTSNENPLSAVDVLRTAVNSHEPYLQPDGELHDAALGTPAQYGTPYHAFCQAVLALKGPPGERDTRVEKALRGIKAALRHVGDPSAPSAPASINPGTGAISFVNHRDFFWPPILRTFRILKGLGAAEGLAEKIAAVDIMAAFKMRPPSNWAAVWVSGEWMRFCEGLSPYGMEQFDAWIDRFFDPYVFDETGYYAEPGLPNSYDLWTRYPLALLLSEGYQGAAKDRLENLLVKGFERSLAVQLSDGSMASAHRSTGQAWTVGLQCGYFAVAARLFEQRGDSARAAKAREAAERALAAVARCQRKEGPFSPVENALPPRWRVGYEPYTFEANYSNVAMGYLAGGILDGFDGRAAATDHSERSQIYIEGDPTHRAVVHRGSYSVQLNAWPAVAYDAFGLVDMTFGVGRVFHFASSVRYLPTGEFFNLGLALRFERGPGEIRPIAHDHPMLIGEIVKGSEPVSLKMRSRGAGSPYVYEMNVHIEPDGIHVCESTTGQYGEHAGYKTLLVPYLRDAGTGVVTDVEVERGTDATTVRFQHGEERVFLRLEGASDYVFHAPHRFENRRGLCGLLRIDVAEPVPAICYRVWRDQ
jgi:hypothetical protein